MTLLGARARFRLTEEAFERLLPFFRKFSNLLIADEVEYRIRFERRSHDDKKIHMGFGHHGFYSLYRLCAKRCEIRA